MKSDALYRQHVLDAARRIQEYAAGCTRDEFMRNPMLQDAVVRQLEIIGEASRRLSHEFKLRHAALPWRDIVGMRNRLAHDYLNVSLEVVWEVIARDLPILIAELETAEGS